MTIRARSLTCLALAVLAPAEARAQDAPLYRDPSPSEGPRVQGPLLPARSRATPPPPGTLGPFQPSGPMPGPDAPATEGFEPPRDPLLGIPPVSPPLPALPMPALAVSPYQADGGVEIRRTTKIRGPNGMLGRFHEWFREAMLGPARPPRSPTAPRRSFFGVSSTAAAPAEAPPRLFSWPSWPTWPLSQGR